jgi:hypothetical protein
MPSVVFDPGAFQARYPEFLNVDTRLLSEYFTEATLYLSNADNSPVQDLTRRAMLLNMLTAHIGALGGALRADGTPAPVGRVSQGSQGSVSASFEYKTPGTHSWFSQTQYGAAFWQATLNLRRFQYVARPTVY